MERGLYTVAMEGGEGGGGLQIWGYGLSMAWPNFSLRDALSFLVCYNNVCHDSYMQYGAKKRFFFDILYCALH